MPVRTIERVCSDCPVRNEGGANKLYYKTSINTQNHHVRNEVGKYLYEVDNIC